jgi:hypothetical protein
MNQIIGVVPAGGRATRIHGFFKELMPIGISDEDSSKFVVSSEKIVQSILEAGATAVHFVINDKHNVIFNYYLTQGLFHGLVNFNTEPESPGVFGMPVGIDCIHDQLAHYEFVLMGMPDTVIEPPSAFSILLKLLKDRGADLALGVFRTDTRNKGGYVVFDEATKEVISHVDKERPGFPDDAANSWAIACWTRRFTDFMHSYIETQRPKQPRAVVANQRREILFGDVIDEAIKTPSIKCVADYVDREHGFYWDITAPDKYFDLLRYYSGTSGTVGSAIRPHEKGGSILKAINITERKLRKVVHGTPKSETEVQECFETLLIGADIPYAREKVSFEYSSRAYRPDFTIDQNNLAVEIKLCTTPDREREIVREINDDILAYKTKFANILFVIYDVGAIRDVDSLRW